MYCNLKAEMARKNIDRQKIADTIGKSYNHTREKLLGKFPFTYEEALTIQEELFPDLEIKYLFEKED